MKSNFREVTASAAEDAVTFPVRTLEVSRGSRELSSRLDGGAGSGKASTTRVAQQTLREVLGWRYRTNDSKGFLAALSKTFAPKAQDGYTAWEWKPQTFTLQADLGEVTGAQASIHRQAQVAVEQALPLLDALTPLRPDVDPEDSEAMRAIIRGELMSLVDELARVGGPRVQRIEMLFSSILAPIRGVVVPADPEQVGGQLGLLRDRFGLQRQRVNTIQEEQNFTSYLILVDYLLGLYRAWRLKVDFFMRGRGNVEPFLGTQLVLLSQLLEVILEQLAEAYDAMDSVFFSAAERQATLLDLGNDRYPITVGELLDWTESFAAIEGKKLLEDGGKDGVVAFQQMLGGLTELLGSAADKSADRSSNPTAAFHSLRVSTSLKGLHYHMTKALELAQPIERKPLVVNEDLGDNDDDDGELKIPPPPAPAAKVFKARAAPLRDRRNGGAGGNGGGFASRGGPGGGRSRYSGGSDGLSRRQVVQAGQPFTIVVQGQRVRDLKPKYESYMQPLGYRYEGDDKLLLDVVLTKQLPPGNHAITFTREDCEELVVPNAYTVGAPAAQVTKETPVPKIYEIEPPCLEQGSGAWLTFRGENLGRAFLRVPEMQERIRISQIKYVSERAMKAFVEVDPTVPPCSYKLEFVSECGCHTVSQRLSVRKAAQEPIPVTMVVLPEETEACAEGEQDDLEPDENVEHGVNENVDHEEDGEHEDEHAEEEEEGDEEDEDTALAPDYVAGRADVHEDERDSDPLLDILGDPPPDKTPAERLPGDSGVIPLEVETLFSKKKNLPKPTRIESVECERPLSMKELRDAGMVLQLAPDERLVSAFLLHEDTVLEAKVTRVADRKLKLSFPPKLKRGVSYSLINLMADGLVRCVKSAVEA